ncbi:MAG: rRNA maturation RNase YbeY [Proteobacteria bacterium]|nr:rRNA maturation RNase YbeY [Pseudomonadota bacterium]
MSCAIRSYSASCAPTSRRGRVAPKAPNRARQANRVARAPRRAPGHHRRPPGLTIHLRRATRQGTVPAVSALRRWASLAAGRRARGRELSVLVVGPARSRSLNHRYRGRNYATNVLSFPGPGTAPDAALLGDLVICPQVLQREAREQRKPVRAHWMHLVIHGVLHLVGYDHQRPAEARRMERREVRLLRMLGVADPYRSI